MSHLEQLKQVFDEAGVVYQEYAADVRNLSAPAVELGADSVLEVHADHGPHNGGYCSFMSEFAFKDGRLVLVGSWE